MSCNCPIQIFGSVIGNGLSVAQLLLVNSTVRRELAQLPRKRRVVAHHLARQMSQADQPGRLVLVHQRHFRTDATRSDAIHDRIFDSPELVLSQQGGLVSM